MNKRVGRLKSKFTLRTGYWDDPGALGAFKEFMLHIHGLDFSEWESAGYWDDAYTPFSYFFGDKIVASVCIYLLDAIIDGKATRLAQISGVGTLPEYRRKGLNSRLTDIALEWAEGRNNGIFLFADAEAVPYYRKCGFSPVEEFVVNREATPIPNFGEILKLDPGRKEDLDKIYRYARKRSPISAKFSVMNERLVMFHVLHGLRNHVYEIPDLECLVFYKRERGCLSLFDIVGEKIPSFSDLHPFIAEPSDGIIEFHFFPDKLELNGTSFRPLTGNNPFVRGKFPVERPVFPYTSRA